MSFDRLIGRHREAGASDNYAVDADLAGGDAFLGAGASGRQTAFYEDPVQAKLHSGILPRAFRIVSTEMSDLVLRARRTARD